MGYSQSILATKAGITATQVSNIERGYSFPKKGTRQKIESQLGEGEIDWASTYQEGKLNQTF